MFWCLSGSLPEAYDVSPCGRMPAGGYVFRGAGRPAGENGMAGLGAPQGDTVIRGAGRPAPRPREKVYMRGSASRSDRAGIIYAGFHPAPGLRELFWEKAP